MTRKYLFADESGNFDFRNHAKYPNGPTRFFAVGTAMITDEADMLAMRHALSDLRHELAWNGIRADGAFHATTDKQAVRDAVVAALKSLEFKVDVTILEKSKARPDLYASGDRFYKYALFYHLRYLAPR